MNNYRPISILTCFSKIIEKILYARLYKFLKKHNVICENQSGFQSIVSTVHAMLVVVTYCYDNINESCYTALSFVDLRKAFDTPNAQFALRTMPFFQLLRNLRLRIGKSNICCALIVNFFPRCAITK